MAGTYVEMVANALDAGANHEMLRQMQWEILVEFNNGMWWMMPHEISDQILEEWRSGATAVSFIWDWGGTRQGSFQPEGTQTDISRYIIDFTTMQQRNTDNNRTRKVRILWSFAEQER